MHAIVDRIRWIWIDIVPRWMHYTYTHTCTPPLSILVFGRGAYPSGRGSATPNYVRPFCHNKASTQLPGECCIIITTLSSTASLVGRSHSAVSLFSLPRVFFCSCQRRHRCSQVRHSSSVAAAITTAAIAAVIPVMRLSSPSNHRLSIKCHYTALYPPRGTLRDTLRDTARLGELDRASNRTSGAIERCDDASATCEWCRLFLASVGKSGTDVTFKYRNLWIDILIFFC